MKVHFDIEGTLEECQAFMALIGLPVSTSMSATEQDAIAKEELAKADRLKASRLALEGLEGKNAPVPATTHE